MITSSFRRALVVLRLIVLAGIANLTALAMPGGVVVPSAFAAAAAEQSPRAVNPAKKSHRVDPGDDEEENEASSNDGDDDDEDSDDDCDDDNDNEDD